MGAHRLKVLLDTHALVWFAYAQADLSRVADDAIRDPHNQVFVSAVNALEIAIKHRLGKLPSARHFAANFDGEIANRGFVCLPMTSNHARVAGGLSGDHGDPFDRILAAQALLEGLTIVSRDAALDSFGVTRLW